MAKYIIDVPDNKEYAYVNDEKTFLRIPISLGENETKSISAPTFLRMTPYTEPDRKAIEDEVWEFATICTKMNGADSVDVFGGFSLDSFTNYSYQEAKAKYEEWRKRKDEIRVGDEVVVNGTRAVVMKLDEAGNIDRYFTSNGTTFGNISGFQNYEVTKTNRHFPEVAELLKKMREE